MERHEPVWDVIRHARLRLGYSQYETADALVQLSGNVALTRDDVARWERGKRIPGPYWRHWIGRVLHISDGELAVSIQVARVARTSPGPIVQRRRRLAGQIDQLSGPAPAPQ